MRRTIGALGAILCVVLVAPQQAARAGGMSPTTTTLSSSADPAVAGQPVTLTASVSGGVAGTPTGSVSFAELGQSPFGSAPLQGGQASLTVTLPAGMHYLTASYGGDLGFFPSSDSMTQRWGPPVDAQIAVTGSPDPSPTGVPVTLSAVVDPAAGAGLATGSVTFSDGATVLGTAYLGPAGGDADGLGPAATLTVSNLAAGTHSITASYSGDGNLNPVTSGAVAELIGQPIATSTSLTSSPNPSPSGETASFTVDVSARGSPTFPTGQVTLVEGTTVLATAQVGSGSPALLTLSNLAPGVHQVVASYGGDGADFAPSTSAPVTQVVLGGGATPTSVTVSASAEPAFGQPVTVTAAVTASGPGTPSGTITFTNLGSSLGTVPLGSDGTASMTLTPPAGFLSLGAAYSGDGTFAASVTAFPFGLTVAAMSTKLQLTATPDPAVLAQAVTLTVHLTPAGAASPGPTGHVSFLDGAVTLGTAYLDPTGTATLTVASFAAGSHMIAAQYLGDGNYESSNTASLSEAVARAPTSTSVASSANPAATGQSVTITASVSSDAGTPTGTVAFLDGTASLGSAVLAGGQASVTSAALAPDAHAVTAVYSGDASFSGSTSPVLDEVVLPQRATGTRSSGP